MEPIGIDVHKAQSQICTLTEGGALIERRIQTERGRFTAVLGNRDRARILIGPRQRGYSNTSMAKTRRINSAHES